MWQNINWDNGRGILDLFTANPCQNMKMYSIHPLPWQVYDTREAGAVCRSAELLRPNTELTLVKPPGLGRKPHI